jgi:hypothetical protein
MAVTPPTPPPLPCARIWRGELGIKQKVLENLHHPSPEVALRTSRTVFVRCMYGIMYGSMYGVVYY